MDESYFDTKKYDNLKEKLYRRAKDLPFHAPEVVELSQKIDKYIVHAMEKFHDS